MSDALTEQVKTVLIRIKPGLRAGLTLDSSLDALALDSLDKLTLLFELEDKLEISIPDDDARRMKTVGDVVECVRRLKQSGSASS